MLFQTFNFLLFCAVAFALYWRFPKARLWVLGLANAVFYLAAGWQNLCLFLGASALTYGLGRHVEGPHGRLAMWAGIALNVANLGLFKYAGFVGSNLQAVLPWLDGASWQQLLLPIGISFYSFQHISYLVDRRTKGLASAPNYLHFWVYISFFGHSIAGPIMRGHEFLPQIAETTPRRFDPGQFRYGLGLFGLGLVKKVVIADHLATSVNTFFSHPADLSLGEAWVAALFFAFQIYFDFSAYSDMAVGIGHMFGYRLPQNFRTPYVAANASEFWERWHITLSRWIRDYVYIPLGGSRCSEGRQYINLILAMLVSGLWHGAAWTFVLWGAFHGVLLLGQRAWGQLKARLGWAGFEGRAYHMGAVAAFFTLIVFSWTLFRAASLADALTLWKAMLDVTDVGSLWAVKSFLAVGALLYGLHVLEHLARRDEPRLGAWWSGRVAAPMRGLGYALVVLAVMISSGSSQDFIYFQF